MKNQSSFYFILAKLTSVPRLALCGCAAALFFLVLPSQPRCDFNFWRTPDAYALVLFSSAMLLWIKHPISQAFSILLSAFAAYRIVAINYEWTERPLVVEYALAEFGWAGVLEIFWRNSLVVAFALLLLCCATGHLAQTCMRKRPFSPS